MQREKQGASEAFIFRLRRANARKKEKMKSKLYLALDEFHLCIGLLCEKGKFVFVSGKSDEQLFLEGPRCLRTNFDRAFN